jgi:hypothetical protein
MLGAWGLFHFQMGGEAAGIAKKRGKRPFARHPLTHGDSGTGLSEL